MKWGYRPMTDADILAPVPRKRSFAERAVLALWVCAALLAVIAWRVW